MTSEHLYIKAQTKTIHAEHTHNIYNIRYNITSNAMDPRTARYYVTNQK